jgi:predicted acylesterase/phospholipase RssA
MTDSHESICFVIGGGGVKGYGMLGVIEYIGEQFDLSDVHQFVGTSIGSILGYLLCLGYKPLEIIHLSIQYKVLEQLSSIACTPEMLFSQYGLLEFEPILEFLELMTLSKYGKLFTLESLYTELSKDFACMTYNFTKMRTEMLHYTTTPHLSCLQALQMSSSIPYVFTQCIYNDQVYIDGGIVDNFPIRAAVKLHPHSNMYGIVTGFRNLNPVREISLYQLLTLTVYENQKKAMRKYRKRCRIIDVTLEDTAALDFHSGLPRIMEMFSQGYRIAEETFANF